MEKTLRDLIEISKFAAQHPRLVQGGGGNCSVKSSEKRWVKASGSFLEDISESHGFAIVDARSGTPLDESRGKASMETPLHTLLGSFVIHTHPVAVAALVSSTEGQRWFRELFTDDAHVWVEYATPGQKLYEKVKSTLQGRALSSDWVLFLKNHGLFISSESKERVMDLLEKTVSCAEQFFGKPPEKLPEIPADRYLTPDHVIYGPLGKTGPSPKQTIAVEETLLLVRQALGLIAQKGGTPDWLPASETAVLLGMDEEKYRRKILGNP